MVLIVDDDWEERTVCAELLSRAGFGVAEASDGRSALEWARALRPAAVIMDLHMAGLDGWQTARLLKADESLRGTPIVALSGDSRYRTVVGALDAGCDAYLVKPVPPEQLVDALREALDRSSAPGRSSNPRRRRR